MYKHGRACAFFCDLYVVPLKKSGREFFKNCYIFVIKSIIYVTFEPSNYL